MAKLKLTAPQNKIFETVIAVRITDINYGNHVGNDAMVRIIHEARMTWLTSAKFSELEIGGASLIMADLAVEFKAESFYGDVLLVAISVDDVQKISFDIFYEITTIRNEKQIFVARAKTGMVAFDYAVKKVAVLPRGFLEFLNK